MRILTALRFDPRTVLPAALLLLAAVRFPAAAQGYYVDATAGSDSADGRSPATAWRSLEKVSAATFAPGDTIRFRRGAVWNNSSLAPRGSGAPGRPVVITPYGTGAAPRINTAGRSPYALRLHNQGWWEIDGLEITNLGTPGAVDRYGVWITATDAGTVRGIRLRRLAIHDVNGDPGVKTCGGIFWEVIGGSTPSSFDSLLVEECDIYDVSPVGIANTSPWATRTLTTNTNWTPSTNVIVRNNAVRRTVRNGIIIRVSRRPLIEHNVLQECGRDSSGNALFVFNCDTSIIQYNEGFLTRFNAGDEDAGAFDADYRCKGTLIQYNYAHDNEYGGIVVVSDGSGATTFNHGTVVRYNVLKNNQHHAIRTSGNVTNTTFHNNTIYSGTSIPAIRILYHKSWGGYADNTSYLNNIFQILAQGSTYSLGSSTNNLFDYNLFHGVHPLNEPSDLHKLTADPLFAAPDSAGQGWLSAAGFRLRAGSPAINSGALLAGHPQTDYLGLPVPAATYVDRGAFEYQGPVSVGEGNTPAVPSEVLLGVYPNPFNAATNLSFTLARRESVQLTVHDLLGRLVATVDRGYREAGPHTVVFDASGLPSGVYLCSLRAGGSVDVRRIVLVK